MIGRAQFELEAQTGTVAEAITLFETSTLYRDTLGDGFVEYLCRLKRAEWDRYVTTISEWEQSEYFSAF